MDHPHLHTHLAQHEKHKHYVISLLFGLLALSTLLTSHNYQPEPAQHSSEVPASEQLPTTPPTPAQSLTPVSNSEDNSAGAESSNLSTQTSASNGQTNTFTVPNIGTAAGHSSTQNISPSPTTERSPESNNSAAPQPQRSAAAYSAKGDALSLPPSASQGGAVDALDSEITTAIDATTAQLHRVSTEPADRAETTVTANSEVMARRPAKLPGSPSGTQSHTSAGSQVAAETTPESSDTQFARFLRQRQAMAQLSDGFRHRAQGNITATIESFRASAQSDPESFVALRELGDLYLRLGEREKAVGAYNEAAERAISGRVMGQAMMLINLIADIDPRRAVELRKQFPPHWPDLTD